MSKTIEKICQACEKSFLARRDAKTCSPTCRKRLERSAKRNAVLDTGRIKQEAKRIEGDVREELQRVVAGLLPQQVAYAGAEGLDLSSAMVDEVAADSGVDELVANGTYRPIAVTGESSGMQLIEPTVLKSEASSGKLDSLAGASEDKTTDTPPKVVVSTMSKPSKKSGNKPRRAFHTFRWAALAVLLLLGTGVIISLLWGNSNHNKLKQLNNAQQSQSRQSLHQQTTVNNKLSLLEVKVNALDTRINNLKVGNVVLNTSTTNNSSTNQALGSDVTLSGNTFNGPSQLVQLTSNGLLPVLDGSNLTALNAVALQGNPASYYTNASNLSSGTLGDGRLSSNVPLLNAANTFSQMNTFSSGIILGALGATGGSAICLNVSNQLSACGAGPGTSTLQQTYQASTSPQIALDSSQGGLVIQDAASTIGGNLFAVQSHGGGTTYFAVTTGGISTSGTVNGATISGGSLTGGAVSGGTLTASAVNGLNVSGGTITRSACGITTRRRVVPERRPSAWAASV